MSSPKSSSSVLSVEGLSRHVGATTLLDQVSFDVHAGDRIALVGPSGAGKSLLLRALVGLDPWDAGTLHWQGRLVADSEMPAYRSQVTYISQRPSLLEGTVEENLRMVFGWKAHQGRRWEEARIVEWLARFGLPAVFLRKHQRELSGGEGQIVALLRGLQLEPSVLLLDEPTSAMDPERVLAAEGLVREWWGTAPTISVKRAYLWVTHHEGQAPRISERQWRMERGRFALG